MTVNLTKFVVPVHLGVSHVFLIVSRGVLVRNARSVLFRFPDFEVPRWRGPTAEGYVGAVVALQDTSRSCSGVKITHK